MFLNAIHRAVVAPVSLTIATSALFALFVLLLVADTLLRVREAAEDGRRGELARAVDTCRGVARRRRDPGRAGARLYRVRGVPGRPPADRAGGARRALHLPRLHRCAVHRSADRRHAARARHRGDARHRPARRRADRHAAVRRDPPPAGPDRHRPDPRPIRACSPPMRSARCRAPCSASASATSRSRSPRSSAHSLVLLVGVRGDPRGAALAADPVPAAHRARAEPAALGLDHHRLCRASSRR